MTARFNFDLWRGMDADFVLALRDGRGPMDLTGFEADMHRRHMVIIAAIGVIVIAIAVVLVMRLIDGYVFTSYSVTGSLNREIGRASCRERV